MAEISCDLLFTKDCAKLDCAKHDDNQYVWPIAAGSQGQAARCSVIEAADLEGCLSVNDKMFLVHVNAVSQEPAPVVIGYGPASIASAL